MVAFEQIFYELERGSTYIILRPKIIGKNYTLNTLSINLHGTMILYLKLEDLQK